MKKSIKKIISLLLVAMFLITSLVACGGSGSETPKDPTPAPSGNPTSTLTEQPSDTPTPTETPGNGEIGNGYVDNWFLFGDLLEYSILINEDGTWEMRNQRDTDGSDGYIFLEGNAVMDNDGTLILNEQSDNEVGYATLEGDELTLVLMEDYQESFTNYLHDALVFNREQDSVLFEDNNGQDMGNGGIAKGFVDRWFLFGDLSFQSLTIDKKGAWEMRNPIDTDGSGGYIYCEGYSEMDTSGILVLYEKAGEEVGFVSLNGDELTLVLTTDFEWTFADYLSGDLVFQREGASASFESK